MAPDVEEMLSCIYVRCLSLIADKC